MPRVVQFAAVFTQIPSAKDVFRSDEFEDEGRMEDGAIRRVKKKSWKLACEGKILKVGTKRKMELLKVSSAGEILAEDSAENPVSTRRVELLNRRPEVLRQETLALLNAEQEPDVVASVAYKPPASRRPKKRLSEAVDGLGEDLKKLPCFEPKSGDVNLMGHGIYINHVLLNYERGLHRSDPSLLFRNIINILVPMISHDAISRTGRGDTQKIPESVVAAAYAYVCANADYPGKNELPPRMPFDLARVLSTHVNNMKTAAKKAATSSATLSTVLEQANPIPVPVTTVTTAAASSVTPSISAQINPPVNTATIVGQESGLGRFDDFNNNNNNFVAMPSSQTFASSVVNSMMILN